MAAAATAERDVVEVRPQPGKQELFLASSADIAVYGGAAGGGKTYALLMEPLRHVGNPKFRCVMFRRTSPQIRAEGGLWDESSMLYPLLGARPREQALEWIFPGGAVVKFSHMEDEKDRLSWKGAQIPLIGWDQLEDFTGNQFWYLLSRNRSVSGVRPYVRATCNPDPDSFLAKLIAWWIDQDSGYPIESRAGVLRWFVREGDDLVWADRPEDFRTEEQRRDSTSLTFIPSKLTDNQILLEKDPAYLTKLRALPLVERERLLGGNWKIRATAGKVFRRAWFEPIPPPPRFTRRSRGWDFAGTSERELSADDPDWTVGLRMGRLPDGRYYVDAMERFRETPGKVMSAVKNVAKQDGLLTRVALYQDPAQAGKFQAEQYVRELAGHTVDVWPTQKNVATLAEPISSQAEHGNVCVVEGEWNEAFFTELENFPEGAHDDIVAAMAGAFMSLNNGGIDYVAFTRG